MFKDRVTMLIMSCDKYSDLWDGHVHFLEKFWGNREIKTIIVTDKETNKKYENISIYVDADSNEWSTRFKSALEKVTTDFVFVTLDDYFLTAPVSTEKMDSMVSIMLEEQYDYVRLYIHPKASKAARVEKYKNIYFIDTRSRYSVNLFPGLWKKDFLMKTVEQPRNIWKYEVSLSKCATEENAKCIVSHNNEFPIIDVVRQGKFQRKAKKLLTENGIYNGNRKMHSVWSDFKYHTKIRMFRFLPKWVRKAVRKVAIKMGAHVFSADER